MKMTKIKSSYGTRYKFYTYNIMKGGLQALDLLLLNFNISFLILFFTYYKKNSRLFHLLSHLHWWSRTTIEVRLPMQLIVSPLHNTASTPLDPKYSLSLSFSSSMILEYPSGIINVISMLFVASISVTTINSEGTHSTRLTRALSSSSLFLFIFSFPAT